MEIIEISTIITADPDFIVRDQLLNKTTVTEYAEEPERLPAIELWRDPDTEQLYLLDGQHRIAAHQQRNLPEIAATFFAGTRQEAEARARVANLWHGLSLTGKERRRVRMEVVERLHPYSNNWIAEDFLRCSPNTVAALRVGLEEAGRIPKLDRLKRKGGGTIPRTNAGKDEDDKPDDGLFGSERNIKPPADLMEPEPEPDNNDGGYNVGRDHDEHESTAPGLPSDRLERRGGGDFSPPEGSPKGAQQATLKLAQIGPALAVEVIMHIDDKPHSVPVTLLIADGAVAGIPETAPGHANVLVIGADVARGMGLLIG